MNYLIAFVNLAALYAALAVSLNFMSGYAGLISVAHVAFFGVGAYTSALLLTHSHISFFPALIIASLAASLTGALVGYPSFRLRGDYMLMATLGFGESFRAIIINWSKVTGAHSGIRGIPPAKIAGFTFTGEPAFLILTVGLLLIVCLLSYLVEHSPLGRAMFTIAEDEEAASSLGRNPLYFKIIAMAIGAGMAGAAGAVYASYTSYISPGAFTLADSILVLAMVLIGGNGNLVGAVLGAFLLLAIPEILRFSGLSTPLASIWRQLIYGAALVLIMILRPGGLLGKSTMEVTRG